MNSEIFPSISSKNLDSVRANILTKQNIASAEEWREKAHAEGGILLVDKPLHWTSFDVCNKLKYGLKIKKIGHAGTLDPLASGLLVLCFGRATKLIQEFQNSTKTYIATLKFGATTASFDSEFPEENIADTQELTEKKVLEILPKFVGEISQMPPIFSALKVGGKRAFALARKGQEVELQPRLISVYDASVLTFENPFCTIQFTCSKGTYIRSLARDIGSEVGLGAYLSALRRTHSGSFSASDALTMDTLTEIFSLPSRRSEMKNLR